MKVSLLVIAFALTFVNSFAQKRVVLTTDSVSVSYVVLEDSSSIDERIEIKNLSSTSIYVPDIANRDLNFFVINESLYSHFGVMVSMLGAPNLSLDIRLIEVGPGKRFELPLKVLKRSKKLSKYYFSFDYIRDASKVKLQNGALIIGGEDYVKSYKYAGNNIEGW